MKLLKNLFRKKPKASKRTPQPSSLIAEDSLNNPNPPAREKTLAEIMADYKPPAPTKRGHTKTPQKQRPPTPSGRQPESMADKERRAKPRTTYEIYSPIRFLYEDRAGAMTERTVTPYQCNGFSINARCHMRNAERTFLLDSIVGEITMTETGEMLTIDEWLNATDQ